jgi:hypothetical protein
MPLGSNQCWRRALPHCSSRQPCWASHVCHPTLCPPGAGWPRIRTQPQPRPFHQPKLVLSSYSDVELASTCSSPISTIGDGTPKLSTKFRLRRPSKCLPFLGPLSKGSDGHVDSVSLRLDPAGQISGSKADTSSTPASDPKFFSSRLRQISERPLLS